MGTRGPAPARSGDHSRERDANRSGDRVLTKGNAYPVSKFDPDPEWGTEAMMFWNAAGRSGQKEFWQDTEWALIYFICSEVNAYRRKGTKPDGEPYPTHKISATMFGELIRSMQGLGFTEGDRRRMGIELEKPVENEVLASVTAIENYKARLQPKR